MQDQIFQLQYAMDTFYFLVCGALVMWMAAGFAMLEAGLVRTKNTTEILTKNVALFSISCIMYLVVGYSIMYGGEIFLTGIEGGDTLVKDALASSAENGFDGDSVYAGPSDFFFQVVFVATAMSIVSGAVAERMRLWPFLAFAVVMTAVIYPLEGSWTWGGNAVFGLYSLGDDFGFSDFAGSGIVHMAGAAAALAGVLLLGARKGKYTEDGRVVPIPGANLPLATLGTFILWMGWFGFNGGSQLALGSAADATWMAIVFTNTNLAAAGGVVAAMLMTQIMYKKVDLTMALNGAIAGLVSITAGPDLTNHLMSIIIGGFGGVLVVIAIPLLDRLKIDDVVGAISAHLVAGIWGTLAVGIFGAGDIMVQIIGILAIGVFVVVTSSIVWLVLKYTVGIRANEEDEDMGLDSAELGLEAYPEFGRGSQRA